MLNRFRNMDEISRGRAFFIVEGITGVSQFVLTSGAFLVGFASMLGASDELNGIIIVIPAIVGVLQIFSSIYFERIEKRKKSIIVIASLFRFLLSIIYFVPIIFINSNNALSLFIVLYIIAYALGTFLAPPLSSWIIGLTPIEIRGQYFATKEKISLIFSAILTIVLGKVLDNTKMAGTESLGFIIIGVVLLIMALINVISLINIVEPEGTNITNKYRIKDVLTVPLKSHSFRKVIILFIIWNIGLQIGGPYISVYMVTGLKLSYTYIMTLSVVATIIRVLFSNYWGKLADKKSWFLSTELSIFVLSITHFMWVFVNTNNYFIMAPLLHILAGFAWSGINISLFNLQFLFAKKEGRTMYIGLNAALGGLFSFASASVGAKIISIMDQRDIHLLLLNINNMQVVFLLSGLILAICPLYVKFVIEKGNYYIEKD